MTAIGENGIAVKKDLRYQIFAGEYVTDLNGTRAAIAAGYSKKGADVAAIRLLGNARVRKLIAELIEKRAKHLDLSADKVLEELSRMGFANMMDYIGIKDGDAYVDLSRLTREQAAAIQEYTVDHTGGTGDGERRQVMRTRFRLADKTRALELLGKYLTLFTERADGSGLASLAEILQARRKALSD